MSSGTKHLLRGFLVREDKDDKITLTNKRQLTLPSKSGISKILWPASGNHFIAERRSATGNPSWSVYNSEVNAYTDLPSQVTAIDWLPQGNKIIYIWLDSNNKSTLNTAIPTGTQRQIGQFKFSTAAANNLKNGTNKWTLSGVIFNVNATNVALGTGDNTAAATSTFKFYNKADQTVKATCTAAATSTSGAGSSGSLVVTCRNLQTTSSVLTQIDPGTDATFVLEAQVANAKISNNSTSTLQVSLQNFTDPAAQTLSSTDAHIVWADLENSSTVTKFNWVEYPETSVNGTSYNG
jgi:hypothetical protein